MKIAIPTLNDKLCEHFGHCQNFTIVETDDNKILSETKLDPPVHQPGAYPKFLAENGVKVIIAGGMGVKAQEIFAQNNIDVCVGVAADTPKNLVEKFLNNELQTGANLCDH